MNTSAKANSSRVAIEKIQEILFEHRQKLPQGDFKIGQDMLKIIFDEQERSRFLTACKPYTTYFIRISPEVDVGDNGAECTECSANCSEMVIELFPRTVCLDLTLHPLLVEYLRERTWLDHEEGSSPYSYLALRSFLEKKNFSEDEVSILEHKLDEQYREVIYRNLRRMQDFTRIKQPKGCKNSSEGWTETVLRLYNKVILYKIEDKK